MTGVQTCALPIFENRTKPAAAPKGGAWARIIVGVRNSADRISALIVNTFISN